MLETLALVISFGPVARTLNDVPIRPLVKLQLDSNLRPGDEQFEVQDYKHLLKYTMHHMPIIKCGHDQVVDWFTANKQKLLKKHQHSDTLAELVTEIATAVDTAYKMVRELRCLVPRNGLNFVGKNDDVYE